MKKGSFVKIDYIGKISDEHGEIFDLTKKDVAEKNKIYNPKIKYAPAPVIVGAGFIIKGLDEALEKMKVGEKKKIKVPAEKAFGPRKKELIKVVPESAFKNQKYSPRPGMVVDFGGTKGRIQSVTAGRVRIDFNNPLAGKDLFYEVEIKEEIKDKKGQIKVVTSLFHLAVKNVAIKINTAEIELDVTKPVTQKQKILTAGVIKKYIDGIKKVKFIEIYDFSSAKPANKK
ncbi:MAG: peptidylprolyl isomerase [Candidatus Aenigmatarchaeota archaeon]|nr:MAG: peptidylprolyl isomerase [Candidatus Aenigmarchaeota archaeon]